MPRILVTGASGFAGRHLTPALAAHGHDVRAAARIPARIPHAPRVTPVAMPDLATPADWQPLLDGVDMVIHLAGLAHRAASDTEHDRITHLATAELAAAAQRAGIAQFVFISSIAAQTGPSTTHIVTETDSPQPTTAYGATKLKAEAAIAQSGAPFTILRPVVIAGDGAKGNFATLQRLARLPLPLPIGALTNRRSILGIGNFVSAVLTVLGNPAALGQIFVVADPAPLTVGDIVAELRRRGGRSPGLVPVPSALLSLTLTILGQGALWARLGEPLIVDPAKLMALGWRPEGAIPSGR